jgi:hypothetical protein
MGVASSMPLQPDRASAGAFAPAPTYLSDFTSARRQAIRPPEARGPRFDADFDDDTLFFDAFHADDGRHVVLIGPPLFNLAPAFATMRVRDAAGRTLNVAKIRHLDRQMQIWVTAPADLQSLTIETALGSVTLDVGQNKAHLFAGRRVLLTKSRNNPLPWILDWIRFNRDVNGADAVLFYDNGSTQYSLDTLRAAIGRLRGIRASVVAHWPFKFGPQGPNARRHWDSDFCELGAWEHARWHFLAKARSVLTADVDELAFGRTKTPFEAAETSLTGVARYHGRWVVGLTDAASNTSDLETRRHRDYETVLRREPGRNRLGWPIDAARCFTKWAAVPSRCPPKAQWRTHTIRHWPQSYLTRGDIGFAHFRPINTSWKYDRDDARVFDPALHEHHAALAAAMARVDWTR